MESLLKRRDIIDAPGNGNPKVVGGVVAKEIIGTPGMVEFGIEELAEKDHVEDDSTTETEDEEADGDLFSPSHTDIRMLHSSQMIEEERWDPTGAQPDEAYPPSPNIRGRDDFHHLPLPTLSAFTVHRKKLAVDASTPSKLAYPLLLAEVFIPTAPSFVRAGGLNPSAIPNTTLIPFGTPIPFGHKAKKSPVTNIHDWSNRIHHQRRENPLAILQTPQVQYFVSQLFQRPSHPTRALH
jgi:hypothetical protein